MSTWRRRVAVGTALASWKGAAVFTLEEVRRILPVIRGLADEVIALRCAVVDGTGTPADRKGHEARLAEILDGFTRDGIEVKGYAPLLLDFPSMLDGREVLLCWLENETELRWYHDPAHGFAGRRLLPDSE